MISLILPGCWIREVLISEGRLEWIKNLEVRDDDVFIVSFPKSGMCFKNFTEFYGGQHFLVYCTLMQ